MKKTITVIAMLIIMLVTLTGCMTVDYEVTINKNGSADISYVMGYSKSFFKSMGATEADIEESFNENGFTDLEEEAVKEGYSIEKISNDEIFGFKATKHIDKLEAYSMSGTFGEYVEEADTFSVTKGFFKNKYSLTTKIDLTEMSAMTEDSADDSAAYANMFINQMKMNYKVNLPEKVTSSNATAVLEDGKTLNWELKPGKVNEIQFEYSQVNTMVFVIIGAIAVLIVAIIVTIIVLKGKKGKTLDVNKEFSE